MFQRCHLSTPTSAHSHSLLTRSRLRHRPSAVAVAPQHKRNLAVQQTPHCESQRYLGFAVSVSISAVGRRRNVWRCLVSPLTVFPTVCNIRSILCPAEALHIAIKGNTRCATMKIYPNRARISRKCLFLSSSEHKLSLPRRTSTKGLLHHQERPGSFL